MSELTFKTGDTLTISGSRTDSAGNPITLASTAVKAEMKTNSGSPVLFTATITDVAAGEFTLSLTASETGALTAGSYFCDVQFTSGVFVESTDTFTITMVEDITSA